MAIKNNIVQKKKPAQGTGLVWLVLISLFFCELLVYTGVRTESTQTLLRVSRARQELTRERAYKKALLVERGRLKSENRIIKIARTRLNLRGDVSTQTIYLPGDEG